jgi:rubrerythrin
MKFSNIAATILGFVATTSAAAVKRDDPTDVQILQYALTLEHLENAFYSGALKKFDDKAFTDAGFPSWARGRLQQIADHEAGHVTFLTKALGDGATKPCTYKLYVPFASLSCRAKS